MTHIACPEGSILRGGINEHTNACLAAFSYPDFTVGPGVSPDHASYRLRAVPPIGNWALQPSPCPEGMHLDF